MACGERVPDRPWCIQSRPGKLAATFAAGVAYMLASVSRALAVLLLCLSSAAWADARAQLDAFTHGLKTLDGQFEQQVFDPNDQLSESSTGRIALATPRQFRWEYAQPFPQLIVADGEQVWIFDPELEQVTVRQQDQQEQQSPLAALIDPGELERQFVVAEAGERDAMQWLVLHPRKSEDAQISEAWLAFADGALRRMELRDALGQRTVIAFTRWQRNPRLAADTFRFTPPAGADVIGDSGAEVIPLRD